MGAQVDLAVDEPPAGGGLEEPAVPGKQALSNLIATSRPAALAASGGRPRRRRGRSSPPTGRYRRRPRTTRSAAAGQPFVNPKNGPKSLVPVKPGMKRPGRLV